MSLREEAYQRLKSKIVSLELSPGAVIDEAALKAELGLGRTPVREALQRLSLEKLVAIVPRRGTFVTDIRITDLQWLFEVRLVLESLAAQLAASRGSQDQWQRMEATLGDLPGESVNNEALIAVDQTCHEIIYEAAGNKLLQDILSTLYALSLRLWYLYLPEIGDMREAVLEHRSVMEALKAGDAARAAQLLEKHIRAFQEEIRSVALRPPDADDGLAARVSESGA